MKRLISIMITLAILMGSVCIAGAEAPVTINITRAVFNLQDSDPAQVQKVEDAINAYIADKINVRVHISEISSNGYGAKVDSLWNEGKIHLLWTASWEDVIGANALVSQGRAYDISGLIRGTRLYSSISENQWNASRYNGKYFFIPVYKDNVEGYDFMFRRDLAEAHGWQTYFVERLADLEPMLADAKNDGIKYPFLTQSTAMFYRWYIDRYDFFTADARTNFFAIDRRTNEVVNTLQTEDYRSFCKLMGRWAEMGYISPDDVNRVTGDTTTQTKDWAISWWTDVPVNAEATARYGQPVVMQRATGRYAHSSSVLGSCYCITAYCTKEQAEAAIRFLGLLYTDSYLADLYTFGIEGEDFEYTQTGNQTVPHVTVHSTKYNHSMWESAPATIVSPMFNEPDNKADLYMDFNANAMNSAATGFRFNSRPVQGKYDACRDLFEQYGFVLENGGVPEDQVVSFIGEYQKKLNAAGYQDVLAEFREQYRAWKKERRNYMR